MEICYQGMGAMISKHLIIGLGIFSGIFLFNKISYAAMPEWLGGYGSWGNDITPEIKNNYLLKDNSGNNLPLFPNNSWYNDESNKSILTLAAYAVIDYNQSKNMFSHPDKYYEANPLLGERPTNAGLLGFGIAGIGALYIAKEFLPDNWKAKQILVDSVVSTEKFNVEENQKLITSGNRTFKTIPIILTFRW